MFYRFSVENVVDWSDQNLYRSRQEWEGGGTVGNPVGTVGCWMEKQSHANLRTTRVTYVT